MPVDLVSPKSLSHVAIRPSGPSEQLIELSEKMSGEKDGLINGTTQLPGFFEKFNAIISCCVYMFCSISMVLSNKYISYGLEPEVRHQVPELGIIMYQCIIAVILVEGARFFKYVDYPNFNLQTAKSWLPLNLLFITMLCSGFISLVYVSVPIVTIFKNVTNMATATGDYVFFGETSTPLVITAIGIMTLGAVFSGMNDLAFSWIGYTWIAINCLSTSGYVLYMRFASTTIKLPKFGMVFYNNLLSALILLPLAMLRGEMQALSDPRIMTTSFILYNTFAGCVGFFLNFASLWCVSSTSATTYAIVGSLCKVPVTVLGFILFKAPMTSEGLVFVTMATLGGFLFAYAKIEAKRIANAAAANSTR